MTRNEKKMNDIINIQLEREHFIYMRNELIDRMEYKLNKQHLLLLRYLIKNIQKNDAADKLYSITISNFCKVMNIKPSGYNYGSVKKAFGIIDNETQWIESDEDVTRVKWFDELKIKKKTGTIVYSFHKSIAPYLFDLVNSEDGYTKYKYDDIIVMDTKYGVRLYEFLREHHNQQHKVVNISLDTIKTILGGKNYKTYKDFRRFVLDKAIDEVNKYSFIRVSGEGRARKGERAFSYVRFILDEVEYDSVEYWVTDEIQRNKLGLPTL